MRHTKGCFTELPFDLEKGLPNPPIEIGRKAKNWVCENSLPLISICLSVAGLVVI